MSIHSSCGFGISIRAMRFPLLVVAMLASQVGVAAPSNPHDGPPVAAPRPDPSERYMQPNVVIETFTASQAASFMMKKENGMPVFLEGQPIVFRYRVGNHGMSATEKNLAIGAYCEAGLCPLGDPVHPYVTVATGFLDVITNGLAPGQSLVIEHSTIEPREGTYSLILADYTHLNAGDAMAQPAEKPSSSPNNKT